MLINLFAPASFSARSPIAIYDDNGHLFYSQKQPGTFNLPPGTYKTTAAVMQLPMFSSPAEVYQGVPTDKTNIKWMYGKDAPAELEFNGPANKASFYPHINTFVIDEQFVDSVPKYIPMFLIGHEDAHHHFKQSPECLKVLENPFSNPDAIEKALGEYYAVEHQCDLYSRNKMIRNGYNDSQVMDALKMLLEKGNPRIQMMKDSVNKTN